MLGLLTGSTVTAGVVLAALAAYVWRRRGSAAGLSLAVLLLSVAWWAAAYAMELSASDAAVRSRWGDLKYLGIGVLPAAWLVFVLQYTGRVHLVTRRVLLLLTIEPLLVWTLLAIPATHDLVRYYAPVAPGQELPLVASGPIFWVHLIYSNVLVIAGLVTFVLRMAALSRVYRVAAVVLVAMALLPWVANLLHNFEVGPFARIDLTPFAFVLTGAALVWGLYRERLINLSSIAWGVVVQTMPDAVILRDAFGRVSDVNPASVRLLGRSRADLIGRDLTDVLPTLPAPREAGAERGGAGTGSDTEVSMVVEGTTRHFDVRRHSLRDASGAPSGELVMLRDVTTRRETESRLRQLLSERTRVAATLQASLLPPRLPQLVGCELAARYEPAGGGHEIGGDFYDVFPIDGSRWGLFLGDVSGKGAGAASVTAMIRYTLRTLAFAETEPSQVLRQLNEVLLRDAEEERYCTVVYAVLRPCGEGMDVRLCLGGHHPPALRHSDGRVEPVGVLGTALGLFPEPSLTDACVRLGPGDLLCLFTDGLVEARGGSDLFGFDRAAAVLAADRAKSAQDSVDHLAGTARQFSRGPLRDDLAILAVWVPERADRLVSGGPSTELPIPAPLGPFGSRADRNQP